MKGCIPRLLHSLWQLQNISGQAHITSVKLKVYIKFNAETWQEMSKYLLFYRVFQVYHVIFVLSIADLLTVYICVMQPIVR